MKILLGWDAVTLAQSDGWLAGLLTDPAVPIVMVARCSVPSMRRTAVVLELVTRPGRAVRPRGRH